MTDDIVVVAGNDSFKPAKYGSPSTPAAPKKEKEKTVHIDQGVHLPRIVPEGRATKLGGSSKPKVI